MTRGSEVSSNSAQFNQINKQSRLINHNLSVSGLILSGNEISQILLSVLLSYFGGQRNRPRFIAWGVVFCALSCFILALPHFIYGAGEDALSLTKEFMDSTNSSLVRNRNDVGINSPKFTIHNFSWTTRKSTKCSENQIVYV